MGRTFLVTAAWLAFLAVGLGAFGAHGLKTRVGEADLAIWRTAVDYHMWHALGLGGVGLLAERHPDAGQIRVSGWLMLAGILVFSGSLYVLVISGWRWLGMITPLGGLSLMAAWAALAIALRSSRLTDAGP